MAPARLGKGRGLPSFFAVKGAGWRSREGRTESPEGSGRSTGGIYPKLLRLCSSSELPALGTQQTPGLANPASSGCTPPPRQQTNPCGVPSPSPGGPATLGQFLPRAAPPASCRVPTRTPPPRAAAFSCGAHGVSRSSTESPSVRRPAAHAQPVECFGMPGLEPWGQAALLPRPLSVHHVTSIGRCHAPHAQLKARHPTPPFCPFAWACRDCVEPEPP